MVERGLDVHGDGVEDGYVDVDGPHQEAELGGTEDDAVGAGVPQLVDDLEDALA